MRRANLKDLKELFRALGNQAKKSVSLAPYTTVKIGGPAGVFYPAATEKEMLAAVGMAESYQVPWFLLGGGSNLLISETGFNGLVILNRISGMEIIGTKLLVASGEPLARLIDTAISHGLGGIEKMSGIPGTVGGAIYGNAGAYGQTISDHLLRVKVYEGKKISWWSKNQCQFSYRDSVFKKKKPIILLAEFKFPRSSKEQLKKTTNQIIAFRSAKYPKALKCPGSFFKNVIVSDLAKEALKKIPPEVISHGKVPAGYLLEVVGARGKQKGRIKIAPYHGNLFYNLGNGRAEDFFLLAKYFQKKVKAKFGVVLTPEVQLIGFAHKF